MQKRHVLIIVLAIFIWQFWIGGQAVHARSLQTEIQSAEAGEAITIPAGTHDGPLMIDKPLTLIGEKGAIIRNVTGGAAMTIAADDVTLTGLSIIQDAAGPDASALKVTGNRNQLRSLRIQTAGMGIVLEDAHANVIEDIAIEGSNGSSLAAGNMSSRHGNGIDLFRSHDNHITGVTLRQVQDGIYIEHSKRNIVRNNDVRDSRYGYHLMFTEDTTLSENTAQGNITGAMVMGTKGTAVKDNHFFKQASHVHSQGLMLYDVTEAIVEGNRLEHNLIGLFIETSAGNRVQNNQIYANHVGVEMHHASENLLQHNTFVGNVISARAKDSQSNRVLQNFWDEHLGLDADGDRISDIPYYADWLFPVIIAQKPAYQIFAGSTGMLFLGQIVGAHAETAFTDTAPLMEKPDAKERLDTEYKAMPLIYYSLALLICTLIVAGGRKK